MSAPGRPIAAAYRATLRQAAIEGWGKLPSLRTAGRAWEAVPNTVKAVLRGDKTALKRLAPTGRRVYDMPLHDSWTMDGRKLDLMCRDVEGRFGPPGKKGRLYLYAVEEMRSRYVVGYAFGFELTADLVRKALLSAIDHTGLVIPRQIQADNGAEFAAKEITGGASFRRRFKVKEDEVIGMLTMLGIEPQFATVAHGQAKPVERLFRTLAQEIETRPEFRRAYMGSNPERRPEEYDVDHAVSVDAVIAAYEEGIKIYNNQKHRGAGMQGKTPRQVYTELMTAPGFIMRKTTQSMRRMAALAALPVTLQTNGTFCICGASYWSQKTAELTKGRGYTARFNSNDLAEPVYLYQGTKLVAENVPQQIRIHGNNDKAAAKQLAKAKNELNKLTKSRAKALAQVLDPEAIKVQAAQKHPELIDKETGEILPQSKVVKLPTEGVQVPTGEAQISEQMRDILARYEESQDREFFEKYGK
jgi:transposase InsO family protein